MSKRTRPSGKVHVCSCPTSLQNFANFSAELRRLLCRSFTPSLRALKISK
ncbi:MAG: hypothetical protein II245_06770 [Bacteroidaceae bacterium]|nr:hypothetical protein [Bacteroidaceae bacterium]